MIHIFTYPPRIYTPTFVFFFLFKQVLQTTTYRHTQYTFLRQKNNQNKSMSDNMIKQDYDSNFSYMTQNQTGRNMSIVPQQTSSRPSTLPINGQFMNNPSLFTPTDYAKFSLSTPDLINVLTTQTANDGQPSPGLFIPIKISI